MEMPACLMNEGTALLCRPATLLPLGCLAFFPKPPISDNDVNCLLAIKYLLRPKTGFLESMLEFSNCLKNQGYILHRSGQFCGSNNTKTQVENGTPLFQLYSLPPKQIGRNGPWLN